METFASASISTLTSDLREAPSASFVTFTVTSSIALSASAALTSTSTFLERVSSLFLAVSAKVTVVFALRSALTGTSAVNVVLTAFSSTVTLTAVYPLLQ